jgi:hypothetical protein
MPTLSSPLLPPPSSVLTFSVNKLPRELTTCYRDALCNGIDWTSVGGAFIRKLEDEEEKALPLKRMEEGAGIREEGGRRRGM